MGPAWRVAVALLSIAGATMWVLGYVAFRPGSPAGSTPRPTPEPFTVPVSEGAPLPVFGVGDGIRLRMLTETPVAVAFHEASYRDAVRLRPLGVCGVCRNRWKFTPPPPVDGDLRYMVMDTRGRSQPATSAVDVVVRRRGEIVSPVDGVVRRVKRYRLYGRYRDTRVEIRPRGTARRLVVLLHLSHVRLRSGDRVEASVTPIGFARRLPFQSQVDRYVPGGHPHVHVEVKRPAAGPK